MNIKKIVVDFVAGFAVTLVVSVIVTLLLNLIIHGVGTINWKTSVCFATLFGIVLPSINNYPNLFLHRTPSRCG